MVTLEVLKSGVNPGPKATLGRILYTMIDLIVKCPNVAPDLASLIVNLVQKVFTRMA